MEELPREVELNFDSMPELQDSVLTIFSEEDGKMTLAIFDQAQWEIVNDLVSLTKQTQEEVVKSLAKEIPNVVTFNPDDYDF